MHGEYSESSVHLEENLSDISFHSIHPLKYTIPLSLGGLGLFGYFWYWQEFVTTVWGTRSECRMHGGWSQTGLKGCQLEVETRRAPRLLVSISIWLRVYLKYCVLISITVNVNALIQRRKEVSCIFPVSHERKWFAVSVICIQRFTIPWKMSSDGSHTRAAVCKKNHNFIFSKYMAA